MTDLPEFLLARIAEDEALARDWRHHPGKVQVIGGGDGYRRLADPARVLAECEAKRSIVEMLRYWESQTSGVERETLELLTAVYADHPDYRDEWRP